MFTSACQTHETTQWTGPAIARWKGRHHSVSSARHVTGSDSCVALLWAPTQHVQSTCARPEISPASVSSSLWSPAAGQLREGPLLPQVIDAEPLMTLHWRYMPMLPRRGYGFAGLGFGTGSVIFQGRSSMAVRESKYKLLVLLM